MSRLTRIKQRITYYETRADGYSGMSKFEFPLYLSPEQPLISNVIQVPNKLGDHSEATFSVTLSNAINRSIVIESIEFRLASPKGGQPPLTASKLDTTRSSLTPRGSIGGSRLALKYLYPEVSNLDMLKNESLGVLLSLTKDLNLLVVSLGLQATDLLRRPASQLPVPRPA